MCTLRADAEAAKNLAAAMQIEDADIIFEHTLVIEKTEGEDKRTSYTELWGMPKAREERWSKQGLSEADAAQGLLKYGTHCHDC